MIVGLTRWRDDLSEDDHHRVVVAASGIFDASERLNGANRAQRRCRGYRVMRARVEAERDAYYIPAWARDPGPVLSERWLSDVAAALAEYEAFVADGFRDLAALATLLALPTDVEDAAGVVCVGDDPDDGHGPPPAEPFSVTPLAAHAPPAPACPRFHPHGVDLAA